MQGMQALPKAVLHVLRHAVRDLTRQARQARGGFLAPGPPKGSKILEKAAMLAADCRLQDCKDQRIASPGSNTPGVWRVVNLYVYVAAPSFPPLPS